MTDLEEAVMDLLKKGLNGFTLKILALLFMTFDHVASFLWGAVDIPIWFNWIGRLSAPIFIFMVVEGFYHTRNKKRYMVRLYGWSVMMAIGNELMNSLMPHPEQHIIMNNIFATMFVITVYLMAIECVRTGRREKSGKHILIGIVISALPILFSGMVLLGLNGGNLLFIKSMLLFAPSIMFVEGGIVWVVLGIGLYLCRENKKAITIFYTILSGIVFMMMVGGGFEYTNLFLLNYQWMMLFALPFMLLYNGQKGRSLKYFFYLYYPLHCYVLYAVGILIMKYGK